MSEYPMQPIYLDDGRPRFEKNPIVEYLIDQYGLIKLDRWCIRNRIDKKYIEQLYQLWGYSVDGYGDLQAVREESHSKAAAIADELLEPKS